ncbi:MAG: glycosyltransferase [Desulfovibrionaceae bacterium]|nr:glycosyltransferase [Desulfovibrionaceae bacterium]
MQTSKQSVLEWKQKTLEAAAAAHGLENIPETLFNEVLEFLTYCGDSPILAHWVKDVYLHQGQIQPPCPSTVPLVSVIIPCHNYGHYLRECVESVLMQTMTDWEIIIVDDGSTDNTPEVGAKILKDFPSHKIRFLSQPCQGIVQPRNRGVTLAKGEFILPLDADDLIAPTFLEKTVAVLKTDESLGYVSTRALFFGDSNKIWPMEPFVPLALLVTNQQGNTTLYRKSMWKDVGGYEKEMIYGYMDWEFWIQCTKAGWVGRQLEEPLYLYRRKSNSVVMKAKKRDINIKKQIVHLHPEIYDPAKLAEVGDDINNKNWIPPSLLRSPLLIPPRPGEKPQPAPFSVGEYLSMQSFERMVLNQLAEFFPEQTFMFMSKDAGRGRLDSFIPFFNLLSKKMDACISSGKTKEAGLLALQLLAAYPLCKNGVIKALKIISLGEQVQAAYEAGKLYYSIFPDDEMADTLSCLLYAIIPSGDSLHNLGLLEAAAQLAKGGSQAAEEAAKMKERLGLASKRMNDNVQVIWYVADEFSYVRGNIHGVNKARSMTLASILRGESGPEVCIVTPLHGNIGDAVSLFYAKLAAANAGCGYRLPQWHFTSTAGNREKFVKTAPAKPAAVITEGVRLDAYNYFNKLECGDVKPTVFIHHASPKQYQKTFTGEFILPELMHALDKYSHNVCVSQKVIDEWRQIPALTGKNWAYIPNCVPDEEDAAPLLKVGKADIRRKLRLPENRFIGLCLASIQNRKGQDILLEQLHSALKEIPDALFLFVGPVLWHWGGGEIVEYAQTHFSPENVQILGSKDNPLEYVRAADCLILPSREEALPLTILEAMLLGRPVIGSDVNGIPEMVEHGKTGLLFSHDTPELLAEHILQLAGDGVMAENMGLAGQERYYNLFSRERHAARWREFISDIIYN